jgi:hypothetical protein
VKHAYLQMNASGIQCRLDDVHKKKKELRGLLQAADAKVIAQWTCPNLDSGYTINDSTDDPNCLCCPQETDFNVDEC